MKTDSEIIANIRAERDRLRAILSNERKINGGMVDAIAVRDRDLDQQAKIIAELGDELTKQRQENQALHKALSRAIDSLDWYALRGSWHAWMTDLCGKDPGWAEAVQALAEIEKITGESK